MKPLLLGCLPLLASLGACDNRFMAHANRVVVVQPLGSFSALQTAQLVQALRPVHARLIVKKPVALPASAYYMPRKRYRADSLLAYLLKQGNADTVLLGLTNQDISTTKGAHADWGIMGLGFTPGPACVVSTYRLPRQNRPQQLYKLALHELGHTQGLPHCPAKSCYMRDAEGGNHLQEETRFCEACRARLSAEGWRL